MTSNKSNMADGRHIENRILAISPRFIVRLTRNLVLCSGTGLVTKLAIFENSRWRTAAIWKIVSSLYLSRGSSDFNEIWCAAADFGLRTAMWQSIKILQIHNGGRPPYWKSSFGYISEIYCPNNAKFCVKKQNHVQTYRSRDQNFENSRWRTAAILKMVLSPYLSLESSDFNEIWCADSHFGSRTVTCTI